MKYPIFQLDAFTNRLFGGNPAAVVILERWLDDQVLQAIAAENNLAETAFVIPAGEPIPLRWFTPTIEVDLCGHATLAAAQALFAHYFTDRTRLSFATRSGTLEVFRDEPRLFLDFPSRPGTPRPLDERLVNVLGLQPVEAVQARDLLVAVSSEREVREFVPDFAAIESLDTFALILTAPGEQVDFVSRFFAPAAGVPEDPVTGSAHCTLIPYWSRRLGKTTLRARQISRRGGELSCELRIAPGGDRVLIGGEVVEYLRGEITV